MPSELESRVFAIQRPSPSLMKYYFVSSLVVGPFFPLLLIPLFFRYETLRYEFDDEGIQMSWGILFRRQITLTYARIQDIHLVSNFVERWFGLARVQIQTASASATAEMTIEGLHQFAEVRDYLYSRMRGIQTARTTNQPASEATGHNDLASALRTLTEELRRTREALERKRDQ